jgi:hypothetical protein
MFGGCSGGCRVRGSPYPLNSEKVVRNISQKKLKNNVGTSWYNVINCKLRMTVNQKFKYPKIN